MSWVLKEFQAVCDSYEFMGSECATQHSYHRVINGYAKDGWRDDFLLVRPNHVEGPNYPSDLYLFVHHRIHYSTEAVAHQHSMYIQVIEGYTAELDELLMYVHEFANEHPDTHTKGVEFAL